MLLRLFIPSLGCKSSGCMIPAVVLDDGAIPYLNIPSLLGDYLHNQNHEDASLTLSLSYGNKPST